MLYRIKLYIRTDRSVQALIRLPDKGFLYLFVPYASLSFILAQCVVKSRDSLRDVILICLVTPVFTSMTSDGVTSSSRSKNFQMHVKACSWLSVKTITECLQNLTWNY